MIERKHYFISIFVLFILFGCSDERTFLSEELKRINPYRTNQELTFISSDGAKNIVKITNIRDKQFPDGLGVFTNERLFVAAYRESKTILHGTEERILTLFAKTDKNVEKIDFSISLKDTYLQMAFIDFPNYRNRTTRSLNTSFGNYNDIILFKNEPNRRIDENEIVEFYWSKSLGYVRLIQKNGTIWDLNNN